MIKRQKPLAIGLSAQAILSAPGRGKLLLAIIPLVLILLLPGFWAFPARAISVWTRQAPIPTGNSLESVDLVSASEGWASGSSGTILHTTDGGATWTQQDSGTTTTLYEIRFLDALHGWAVGGNTGLYTTDGGQTWQAGSGLVGSLYAVDFVDLNRGWAVGNGGGIFHTTDGGRNWSLQTSPTTSNLVDVDFVDNNNGWAVGGNGTILRTRDGGAKWSVQPSGTTAWLNGVSFVDANEGWTAGGNVLLHTTDSGATWQSQSVP